MHSSTSDVPLGATIPTQLLGGGPGGVALGMKAAFQLSVRLEEEKKKEEDNNATEKHWLPDIVMEMVFEHLPIMDRIRAEHVCRRWRNLLQTGVGWGGQTSISYNDFVEVFFFCVAYNTA